MFTFIIISESNAQLGEAFNDALLGLSYEGGENIMWYGGFPKSKCHLNWVEWLWWSMVKRLRTTRFDFNFAYINSAPAIGQTDEALI